MRPLIALLLSAGILLGVRMYLNLASSLRGGAKVVTVDQTAAEGQYSVDVTLTFDAQADEFALEPVSLVLRHQDKTLLERKELVPAGEPLVVDDVAGLVEGRNEFYFACIPRAEGGQVARAVRIRVLRDGAVVVDQTLWAEAGQTPRGRIVLDIPPAKREQAHDHAG